MGHVKEFWLFRKSPLFASAAGMARSVQFRYQLYITTVTVLIISVFFFRFDKIDVYITQAWHEMKQFLKFIFVPD